MRNIITTKNCCQACRKRAAPISFRGFCFGSTIFFIYKGFIIGIVGVVLGSILGLLTAWGLSHYKMDAEVYYIQKVPVRIDFVEIAVMILITIIITVLATVIPASRAAQITPVDGLSGK